MAAPEHIRSLLSSGKFSDFTIECGDKKFAVHKSIVCSQSKVIEKAVCGDFEEARTGVVRVDDFDPVVLYRMLCFMYGMEDPLHAKLPEESPQIPPLSKGVKRKRELEAAGAVITTEGRPSVGNKLLAYVRLNAIADYYDVPGLGFLTVDQIKYCLIHRWNTSHFLEAADLTATSTGDCNLHKLLARMAVDHMEELATLSSGLDGLFSLDGYSKVFLQGSALRIQDIGALVEQHPSVTRSRMLELDIKSCLATLEATGACSRCFTQFNGYIKTSTHRDYTGIPAGEAPMTEKTYTVSCKSCSFMDV